MEIILRMNVIEQTAFSLVDEEFRIFLVLFIDSYREIDRKIRFYLCLSVEESLEWKLFFSIVDEKGT